ncbi:MAG: DUF3370 family protein [Candidatus Caenarcaniphilales bacterium]|nr:DUF3370 family protein [Candidatus Caenarcaniphilales bacterium]
MKIGDELKFIKSLIKSSRKKENKQNNGVANSGVKKNSPSLSYRITRYLGMTVAMPSLILANFPPELFGYGQNTGLDYGEPQISSRKALKPECPDFLHLSIDNYITDDLRNIRDNYFYKADIPAHMEYQDVLNTYNESQLKELRGKSSDRELNFVYSLMHFFSESYTSGVKHIGSQKKTIFIPKDIEPLLKIKESLIKNSSKKIDSPIIDPIWIVMNKDRLLHDSEDSEMKFCDLMRKAYPEIDLKEFRDEYFIKASNILELEPLDILRINPSLKAELDELNLKIDSKEVRQIIMLMELFSQSYLDESTNLDEKEAKVLFVPKNLKDLLNATDELSKFPQAINSPKGLKTPLADVYWLAKNRDDVFNGLDELEMKKAIEIFFEINSPNINYAPMFQPSFNSRENNAEAAKLLVKKYPGLSSKEISSKFELKEIFNEDIVLHINAPEIIYGDGVIFSTRPGLSLNFYNKGDLKSPSFYWTPENNYPMPPLLFQNQTLQLTGHHILDNFSDDVDRYVIYVVHNDSDEDATVKIIKRADQGGEETSFQDLEGPDVRDTINESFNSGPGSAVSEEFLDPSYAEENNWGEEISVPANSSQIVYLRQRKLNGSVLSTNMSLEVTGGPVSFSMGVVTNPVDEPADNKVLLNSFLNLIEAKKGVDRFEFTGPMTSGRATGAYYTTEVNKSETLFLTDIDAELSTTIIAATGAYGIEDPKNIKPGEYRNRDQSGDVVRTKAGNNADLGIYSAGGGVNPRNLGNFNTPNSVTYNFENLSPDNSKYLEFSFASIAVGDHLSKSFRGNLHFEFIDSKGNLVPDLYKKVYVGISPQESVPILQIDKQLLIENDIKEFRVLLSNTGDSTPPFALRVSQKSK